MHSLQKKTLTCAMAATLNSPRGIPWGSGQGRHTVTNPTSATAARLPSGTRATWPVTKQSTQVQLVIIIIILSFLLVNVLTNLWEISRCKALPLQHLWSSVQPTSQPQDSHTHPLWRKAIQVWDMWIKICTGETKQEALKWKIKTTTFYKVGH